MRDPFASKKGNELIEKEEISLFDYEGIKEEDKQFLLVKEEEIKKQAKIFRTTTLNIGKILFEANEKLANYNKGKYMEWCQSLDISKDQSSYFLKRYNLFLENKDKKELIEKIPNQLIRVLTAKKTDEELVKKALEKEISSIKDFNELKKEYSAVPNSSNEKNKAIEEAEIIEIEENLLEKREEKIKRVVDKVYILLTRATGDENIKQFQDEELEIFEKNIDELNKILDNYEPL